MSNEISNNAELSRAIEEAGKITDLGKRMARISEILEQGQYIGGSGGWVDRLDLSPKQLAEVVEQQLSTHHSRIEGKTVQAATSDDPQHRKAQEIVNEIARSRPTLIKTPPSIYIRTDGYPNAMAIKGKAIKDKARDSIIEVGAELTASPETNYFRALMSHEMAHIINGDTEIKALMDSFQRPDNHKTEILANRMGSIVYGNVPEYYAVMRPKHHATTTHPGGPDFDRELEWWLPFLEKHGAIDSKGNITDVEKAVEAFSRGKWISNTIKATHL